MRPAARSYCEMREVTLYLLGAAMVLGGCQGPLGDESDAGAREAGPTDASVPTDGPAGDSGRVGDGGLVPRGGRCTRTEECMGSPATCEDPYCNEAGYCTGAVNVACIACGDVDGDGYRGGTCGPDCDFLDPLIYPGAPERCDNGLDDDCNGLSDEDEVVCGAPPNLRCESALPIVSGVSVEPSIPVPASGPALTGCGRSVFYQLTLTEESDVDVRFELPSDTPVTTEVLMGFVLALGVDFRAALRPDCASTTDYLEAYFEASCASYEGLYSAVRDRHFLARRVPAGTYVLEVSEGLQPGHRNPDRVTFVNPTVTATARAAQRPSCDAAPIAVGASAHFAAPTRDATTCVYSFGAPDRVHRFALASRARIRARVTPDSASSVQLGVLATCDADVARVACDLLAGEWCAPPTVSERVLEAGTHYLVVESTAGYDLELLADPVDDACAGVPALPAEVTAGDLRGGTDRFGWSPAYSMCSTGNGPDHVYRVDVAVASNLTVTMTSEEYTSVRLTRGCAVETLAQDDGTANGFTSTLSPGTYFVIVDSYNVALAGTYTIQGTQAPL